MSGVRITAGTLKGRKIAPPQIDVRPTSSRAREAVFSILDHEIRGSRFLDLFAGTGVMSIEAISRGARAAVAVDASGKAVAAIDRLAKAWDLPLTARKQDVLRFLSSSEKLEPFDIVYADPPYDFDCYEDVINLVDRRLPLGPGAVVAIEHRKKRVVESQLDYQRLVHLQSRTWGQVSVEFYESGGAETNIAEADDKP